MQQQLLPSSHREKKGTGRKGDRRPDCKICRLTYALGGPPRYSMQHRATEGRSRGRARGEAKGAACVCLCVCVCVSSCGPARPFAWLSVTLLSRVAPGPYRGYAAVPAEGEGGEGGGGGGGGGGSSEGVRYVSVCRPASAHWLLSGRGGGVCVCGLTENLAGVPNQRAHRLHPHPPPHPPHPPGPCVHGTAGALPYARRTRALVSSRVEGGGGEGKKRRRRIAP